MRTDVSHRIRRRPSIFAAQWFRVALGGGVVLALLLLVGPSVASWLGALFGPWGGPSKTVQSRPPEPVTPRLSTPSPNQPSSSPALGTTGTSGATPSSGPTASASKPKSGSSETSTSASGRVAASSPATSVTPPPAATPAPAVREPAPPRTVDATPAPGSLAAPPTVYWVQVGAFLDHKNADRLMEKLKSDGLSAGTTSFEQSRVLYRVLLVGGDGGRVTDDAVERVKSLGHPVETTADGPAVRGLVPLRKAVETSHSLRQQGVPVRLKQEVSSSTFRVVRVGSFATAAEADAALAQLSAKGVEGVVVRER